MDTIFALSSGRSPAAIGIIRISGPAAMAAAVSLAGSLPEPRRATLRRLRDREGQLLDHALVLTFPGPDSATGEDLVELHCHGGRAVIAAFEACLDCLPDLRRAEAGEFTRRALANGRIDLAEAQGLADLLQAETEAQRIAAMSAADGRISRAVSGWMERLARISARFEAAIDFAEEDDVPADEVVLRDMRAEIEGLERDLTSALAGPPVDRLRDGIRVVIAGPPNSGKSTLLNLLAEREAAIVAPIAGTTRDRIDVSVARGGMPFLLTDTAGLAAATDDPIEAIGIYRARVAIDEADILLWLGDAAPPADRAVWVHPRADVPGRNTLPPGPSIAISRHDEASIRSLWTEIDTRANALVPRLDQMAMTQGQRHSVAEAAELLATPWDDVLIGAELARAAHGCLAALLGRNATEKMLDALFGQFCIGK